MTAQEKKKITKVNYFFLTQFVFFLWVIFPCFPIFPSIVWNSSKNLCIANTAKSLEYWWKAIFVFNIEITKAFSWMNILSMPPNSLVSLKISYSSISIKSYNIKYFILPWPKTSRPDIDQDLKRPWSNLFWFS